MKRLKKVGGFEDVSYFKLVVRIRGLRKRKEEVYG